MTLYQAENGDDKSDNDDSNYKYDNNDSGMRDDINNGDGCDIFLCCI